MNLFQFIMIKELWRCSERTLPPKFAYMFLYLCFCFLTIGLRAVCCNRTWSFSLTTHWRGGARCGGCFSCYSHLHCLVREDPHALMLSLVLSLQVPHAKFWTLCFMWQLIEYPEGSDLDNDVSRAGFLSLGTLDIWGQIIIVEVVRCLVGFLAASWPQP